MNSVVSSSVFFHFSVRVRQCALARNLLLCFIFLMIGTAGFSTNVAWADPDFLSITQNTFIPLTAAVTTRTTNALLITAPVPVTKVVIAREEVVGKDHDDLYYSQLLELALTKTIPTYGPYEIKLVPVMPIDNRLMREIEKNHVDVTWSTYQEGIELSVRPVKIRLLKNLSDYRVFLIKQGDQERFSAINSIEELRKLHCGIGSHWPDRLVMEANQLPIVVNISYKNLFKMLMARRFDYFSRGIFQVLPEAEYYANEGLVLEKHLMLHYYNPVYFHVNKTNSLLAERLEEGLKLAIEDGSFDALLNEYPRFIWAQQEIENNKRVVIELKSP